MIPVRVLRFRGETGLRKVGTVYQEYEKTAAFLAGKGYVEIITPGDPPVEQKEEKAKLETKELKLKRETKKRK
jgi:hypothetical protein